jgi:integrase
LLPAGLHGSDSAHPGRIVWRHFHPLNQAARCPHISAGNTNTAIGAEFNEKFIGGIGSEMVERFVRSLHDRDLSQATINKYVAATPGPTRRARGTKLDAGLRAVGWRPKDAPELVPVDLYGRRADGRPAPYSAGEARQIIDPLRRICPGRSLAMAAEAGWRGGLRISEVAGLRLGEISETAGP